MENLQAAGRQFYSEQGGLLTRLVFGGGEACASPPPASHAFIQALTGFRRVYLLDGLSNILRCQGCALEKRPLPPPPTPSPPWKRWAEGTFQGQWRGGELDYQSSSGSTSGRGLWVTPSSATAALGPALPLTRPSPPRKCVLSRQQGGLLAWRRLAAIWLPRRQVPQ